MTKLKAIELAMELAYEEDANQIIGKIDEEWAIAHIEDDGRISQMKGETFEVNSDGLI